MVPETPPLSDLSSAALMTASERLSELVGRSMEVTKMRSLVFVSPATSMASAVLTGSVPG